MSRPLSRELGFIKASAQLPDGGFRAVGRFRCCGCGATLDIPLGSTFNPNYPPKKAEEKGWVANRYSRSGTYCPACKAIRPHHDPESELRKVIPMAIKPASEPLPIREATPDQRVMIRAALDKSFDDSVGTYLDDMSDQRIAELAGVPRIIVERIREAAYGPINVDPVMLELRTTVTALKADIETHQKALDALKRQAVELSSRLEKRLAGAA